MNHLRPIILREYWYGLHLREQGKRLRAAADSERWSSVPNRSPDDFIKIAIIRTEADGYIRSGRDTVRTMREIRNTVIRDGAWRTR